MDPYYGPISMIYQSSSWETSKTTFYKFFTIFFNFYTIFCVFFYVYSILWHIFDNFFWRFFFLEKHYKKNLFDFFLEIFFKKYLKRVKRCFETCAPPTPALPLPILDNMYYVILPKLSRLWMSYRSPLAFHCPFWTICTK